MPDGTATAPSPAPSAPSATSPANPDAAGGPDTAVHAPHPVLHRYYQRPEDRQGVVNELFDDTAIYYDRICQLMSFGTGAKYRGDTLRELGVGPGDHVLDLACGTGQVSAAAAEIVGPEGRVLGVDPSEGMRAVAAARRGVEVVEGDATSIPVSDASFDVVVIGYALRHVGDLTDAFREMRRVLKPGGLVVVLEITPPAGRVARVFVRGYLRWIVPVGSLLVTGSRRAMRLMSYYWDSIEQCVPPPAILEAMGAAGFDAPVRDVAFSMLSRYHARRPGGDAGDAGAAAAATDADAPAADASATSPTSPEVSG